MSCTLVIEAGNAPVLQTIVRDTLTGVAVDDASVVVTLTDAAGAQVTGATWPVALGYLAGSAGVYRVQLDAALPLLVGQSYKATFAITRGSVTQYVENTVYVAALGCGAVLPASSPASPAYQGPSLQRLLNEAQLAYHQVQMGKAVSVVVDQNGERVEFAPSNRAALAGYIQNLKQQLGLSSNSRPASVNFCG